MNETSKVAIPISIIAIGISIAALSFSIYTNISLKEKVRPRTFISGDPEAKHPIKYEKTLNEKKLNNTHKNMLDGPLTPTLNSSSNLPKTSIKFSNDIHDFGKVDINTENKYSFTFSNTGTEPLKISNARGSCGCTVPKWPKEPIMPGQSSLIEVIFRPSKGQAGTKQTKTVTVTANTDPENTILKITALVNKAAE